MYSSSSDERHDHTRSINSLTEFDLFRFRLVKLVADAFDVFTRFYGLLCSYPLT